MNQYGPKIWNRIASDSGFIALCSTPKIRTHQLLAYVRDTMRLQCGATVVHKARRSVNCRAVNSSNDAQADSITEKSAPEPILEPDVEKLPTVEFSPNEQKITFNRTAIKTLEELIEVCEVDTTQWEAVWSKFKPYQGYIKNGQKQIETIQLYSASATFKRIAGASVAKQVCADFLSDAKKYSPVVPPIKRKPLHEQGHLLELALFDAHLGKLCWGEESGDDYDLKLAREAFLGAVDELVCLSSPFVVERILLPIGNDFFNSEGNRLTTTKGTPQQDDSRWQKSFTEGRRLVVDTVERLRQIAPVDIVMVSGNHDMERVYTLGEVLAAWYRNYEDVTVDNSPASRKYYAYGNSLVMFTHGDEEADRDLPGIMANEARQQWAAAIFTEIHKGHLHKKKETRFVGVDEHLGTRIRVLPSLCGRDAWHARKGYMSQRAAEALVFHPQNGPIGHFTHNLI